MMTARDIIHWRLMNQQIARSVCKTPAEVVARLGAMQAQDYPGALWSIGLRLPGSTIVDVEKAIADRTIVRTWPMRGTLHFVAAQDIRWMLELMGPRIVESRAARHVELGFASSHLARCEKIVVKELQGGKQVLRDELLACIERAGISTAKPLGYTILWRLAHEGVICFGSHQGKQPAFALLEEWVPKPKRLAREEALAELAWRYFSGHGPATVQDLAWWSGLKMSDVRAGLEMVSARLSHATFDGGKYWMAPETQEFEGVSPTAYLLPGFDEYLLGYTDRSAVLEARHESKILPGRNGIFKPTVVMDGRVAGIWSRVVKKNSAVITPAPFAKLRKVESRALSAPVARYGEFHRVPASLA